MDLQQNGIPEPKVIYEDKNFLVVNKPAGLLVHAVHSSTFIVHGHGNLEPRTMNHEPKITNHEPTLVDWLLEKYPEIKNVGDTSVVHGSQSIVHRSESHEPRTMHHEPINHEPNIRPGIVHRLDKETSGVMLVARTQEYFEYLKSLFGGRQIKKTYVALVFGKLEPRKGVIEKPIGIKNGTLKRSVHSEKMVKEAITEYRVIKYLKPRTMNHEPRTFSLVEVEPKTGRTHQIRVHLASVRHPIVGDRLYGPKKPIANYQLPIARLMLHALSLEFMTEEGKRMRFEAEPPEGFTKIVSGLNPS